MAPTELKPEDFVQAPLNWPSHQVHCTISPASTMKTDEVVNPGESYVNINAHRVLCHHHLCF